MEPKHAFFFNTILIFELLTLENASTEMTIMRPHQEMKKRLEHEEER
jgi:hypothetical protein